MRSTLTFLLLLGVCNLLPAQQWTTALTKSTTDRQIEVTAAIDVSTDAAALRKLLFGAPHESLVAKGKNSVRISLPAPDGGLRSFDIVRYDISEAGGQRSYPDIKTFYGVNSDDPAQTVFLDWTARGLHASISGNEGQSYFIDPIARGSTDEYQAYYAEDLVAQIPTGAACGNDDAAAEKLGVNLDALREKAADDCDLLEYRIAIATSHQYSNYFEAFSAADAELVQSAVVTALNRVNAILARDAGLRLKLIADNDRLYNYAAAESPFSTNSLTDLQFQGNNHIDATIGTQNYDLGHTFTRTETQSGVLGRATIGSACVNEIKGQAASGLDVPETSLFIVNVFAHEIGHAFGAFHTFTETACNSRGNNAEPGSGSTIMGYAGFCTPSITAENDPYFHGASIASMRSYSRVGDGDCGQRIATASCSLRNSDRGNQRESVPVNTPFVLTANITAAPGAAVTYNWEQTSNIRPGTEIPQADNVDGSLFRSFPADTSKRRYFPRFSAVLAGETPTWEVLPSVRRQAGFQCTALETQAGFSAFATEFASITFVDYGFGAWEVTQPVAATEWSEGQNAVVTWNTAGSERFEILDFDFLAFNTVISLLVDEGRRIIPVDTVENTGEAIITVPAGFVGEARIMIQPVDRVYYDVSDPITILPPAPKSISLAGPFLDRIDDCDLSEEGNYEVDLTVLGTGFATAPITWTVVNLPEAIMAEFSLEDARPGQRNTLTLGGFDQLPDPFYSFRIWGRSADGQVTKIVRLRRISTFLSPFGLEPSGQISDLRPELRAFSPRQSNVTGYDLQVAADSDFTELTYELSGLEAPRFQIPDYLEANTTYYWRIRQINECVASEWATASFTTGDCEFFFTDGDEAFIEPGGAASLPLTVPRAGRISDVDVVTLDLFHFNVAELEIDLRHPGGRKVALWDQNCAEEPGLVATFDDEAALRVDTCLTFDELAFKPARGRLARFDGLEAAGEWNIDFYSTGEEEGSAFFYGVKVCYGDGLFGGFPHWITFNTRSLNRRIWLRWLLNGGEKSTAGFHVERKLSGSDAWAEIGFTQDLKFEDATALPGMEYDYRLRQAAAGGKVRYSEISTASLAGEANIQLYPNPTSGVVNYETDEPAGTPFELTDLTGRPVRSGELRGHGSINLADEAPGVYLLRVGSNVVRLVRL